jgi:hypothetical protein
MVTLREIAACLMPNGALAQDVSVLKDLFGHPTAPATSSVLELARGVTRKVVHLNLIRVGSEFFTDENDAEIQSALAQARIIYMSVDVGIGRVRWFSIFGTDADGKMHIDSPAEAEALTEDWSFGEDAVDVFFVKTFAGTRVGRSPVNGPCDKRQTGMMTGVVVAIEGSSFVTGETLAHEVGHYLGLHRGLSDPAPGDMNHAAGSDNLMYPSIPNGGLLTVEQANSMRRHCFIRNGCR